MKKLSLQKELDFLANLDNKLALKEVNRDNAGKLLNQAQNYMNSAKQELDKGLFKESIRTIKNARIFLDKYINSIS